MRIPFAAALLALLLAGCGDSKGGPSAAREPEPKGFQGKFTAEGPSGTINLVLVQTGDVVEITSGGEKLVGRRVGADRVEATSTEGGLTGHVVLTLAGNDIRMQTKMTDANGESMDLPEMLLKRAGPPQTPAPPGTPAAPVGGGADVGARDARLVAHWRKTDSFGVGEFSSTTDTHLVLDADGTLETWSKTEAARGGGGESAHTRGTWKSDGGQLWIKGDGEDEWRTLGKFALTDTHLMLSSGGSKAIWERV